MGRDGFIPPAEGAQRPAIGAPMDLVIPVLVAKLPSRLSKRKEGWDLFGGTKGEHGSQEARSREGQHDFFRIFG